MTPAARRLAEFASGLELESVPPGVVAAAKEHVLDAIGCGLAAHGLGVGGEGVELALEQGGRPEAWVIGTDDRFPAPSAALANGMLMHALDYDDTHADSITHPSTVIGAAAGAAADAAGATGADVVAALVAGYEVALRIGMAAPSEFHARGFHPTSAVGVFGATAAAGRLAGLDAETLTSAFGIAGSMASGLFVYLEDGTPTKPIHAGWAAHAGLTAVRLARAGALGPPHVLEGRFGLYDAFVGHTPDLEPQLADLGSRWETGRIAYKPYPACHYMHGVLCAAETLTFDPSDVEELVAIVPEAAVRLVCDPLEQKIRPRTEYEGKFSLPYSLATLLLRGEVGLQAYTAEAIADPEVLALAARVRYEIEPLPTYPAAFPGNLRVVLRDGRTLEAECPYQRGSLENPMSHGDVVAKFRANAALALDADASARLEEAVLTLDERADGSFSPVGSPAAV